MNMVWHDHKARQSKTAPSASFVENFADKGSFGGIEVTQTVTEVGGNKKESFGLRDPAQPTHDAEAYINGEREGKDSKTGDDAPVGAFIAATWEEIDWVAARKMRQRIPRR